MRPLPRAAALALLAITCLLFAQEKKPAPKLLVAFPLGVELGKKTALTLRGLNLDHIKAVKTEGVSFLFDFPEFRAYFFVEFQH